jgi:hypothetical protein
MDTYVQAVSDEKRKAHSRRREREAIYRDPYGTPILSIICKESHFRRGSNKEASLSIQDRHAFRRLMLLRLMNFVPGNG